MLEKFFPKIYVPSVYKIPWDELVSKNIKGLIFDIDNTLAPYDVEKGDNMLIELFQKLKQMGFGICLVSNNSEQRVIKFNENLKVHGIHRAQKPFTRNLFKAMKMMGTTPETTAIIGDQVFTDVFGGNRAKLLTILVVPISEKDEWITKIKRGLERKVLEIYHKRKL